MIRLHACVLCVGSWDSVCSERMAFGEDQGCWCTCPETPTTDPDHWLVGLRAVPRIGMSDGVDPLARQKMWDENCEGSRVVRGFKVAGKGVTLCSRRYIFTENSRTRWEAPATLLGRGT